MEFIKKHPSALRYISILGIISLIIPTFFIGNFCGDAGKYFSLAVYAFIAIFGSYEVLKNLSVSKPIALLVSLTTLVIFFFPKNTFNINAVTGAASDGMPAAIKFAINWKAILIIGLAPLVLLIDQNFWKQPNKIIFQLLIASSTMILISIFAKFIWVVNISDYVQLFYFLPIAIVADSFGYFGGKYLRKYIFNGKKLAPKLSPKKTWAGFIVGYVLSALFVGLVGWAMGIFDSFDNSILILVMMSIILPAISPFGDLFFSGVKRFLGIKDFSNLIPGHGGIMDRIDAMSWVIFTLFITFALAL